MKHLIKSTLWTLLAAMTATSGFAATFSSTRPTVEHSPYQNSVGLSTSSRQQGRFIRHDQLYSIDLGATVATTTLTVETVADTGFVADMEFNPLSTTPGASSQDFSVDFEVIVTPADFPNPAVTRRVNGTYTERITISGVTSQPPDLVSSSTSPIHALRTSPLFSMLNVLTLSPSSFIVHGTYEAIGPSNRVTVPFSVEYRRPTFGSSFTIFQTIIRGGSGFADGFEFDPLRLDIEYRPVNPVVFDGTVDDIPFHAEFTSSTTLRYFVPEPSAGVLALVLAATTLRRRTRPRIGGLLLTSGR